jgi:hypothetical protein
MKLVTSEQIRNAGLDVLRRKLGAANAARFLRLFDGGKGDYSVRRRNLFRGKSVSVLTREIRARRAA